MDTPLQTLVVVLIVAPTGVLSAISRPSLKQWMPILSSKKSIMELSAALKTSDLFLEKRRVLEALVVDLLKMKTMLRESSQPCNR